jgi:hypothetical protein
MSIANDLMQHDKAKQEPANSLSMRRWMPKSFQEHM